MMAIIVEFAWFSSRPETKHPTDDTRTHRRGRAAGRERDARALLRPAGEGDPEGAYLHGPQGEQASGGGERGGESGSGWRGRWVDWWVDWWVCWAWKTPEGERFGRSTDCCFVSPVAAPAQVGEIRTRLRDVAKRLNINKNSVPGPQVCM